MAEKVKVKLLKNTPLGNEGDVVEVPKPLAEQMCAWRKRHDGHKDVPYRNAKYLDEKDPEPEFETQSQLLAAGKKNVVETPKEEVAAPLATAATEADPAKGKKAKTGSG